MPIRCETQTLVKISRERFLSIWHIKENNLELFWNELAISHDISFV